ncbi:MAG: exodeoxyribonuclease I, partial [Gammaproteobacteria bacterium]|nr:exodeoxyribonuclease I [Gammaproteobacteria bacterium]
KAIFRRIHRMDPFSLMDKSFDFQDSRFDTLLFRFRARNYPHTLSDEEQQLWQSFRQQRLNDPEQKAGLNFEAFYARCAEILKDENLAEEKKKIIEQLEAYVRSLQET